MRVFCINRPPQPVSERFIIIFGMVIEINEDND
jgi:hypothetical protein